MSIYERLNVRTLINAADSNTILGGSLMPPEVLKAMEEASRHFVNLEELHRKAGERIAELTRNEAAVVTSGAAAALTVATAACITGTDIRKVRKLPLPEGPKHDAVLLRCQRNGFDLAIAQTGVNMVEIGNVEGTAAWELEDAITERTACVFYFVSTLYSQGALPLEEVIRVASARNVPVIVDAAAHLPPVENLWRYTEMGASMVIFSGGKTLRGPQSSGFIVGKKEWIEACRLHVGAGISIGRPMKVGKEEIAGLVAAVERYMSLDHAAEKQRMERIVSEICGKLAEAGYKTRRRYPGPTGQDYPTAGVSRNDLPATEIKRRLENGDPAVITGLSRDRSEVVINPLHLQEDEVPVIIERLLNIGS